MTLPNELHPGFFSAAGGGDVGDTIPQSLRFKGSTLDFQYTPSTTGDRRKWTWATWVKRANMTATHGLLGVSAGASDTQQTEIRIQSTGMLALMGYSTTFRQTNARLRDPSAWYHIVVVLDITNSTANDRIKFYINGQKVTDWDAISNPATSAEFAINYADNTRLGLRPNGSDRLDGYLAETYFLDGIAVTDTGGVIDEFGRYNIDGVWVPKRYTGSFGPNNGYHLKYDSSGYNGSGGIGADHSGLGNNFTATNFDTTAPITTGDLTGTYADATLVRASSGSVATGTGGSPYLVNISPANALGDNAGAAPTWAKIFDGNLSSKPEWYGTQYADNPLTVDFDLRDFTTAGVTSVQICDNYGSTNPRPYDVFLLDSGGTKITSSDWTYNGSLDGQFQTVPVPGGSSPAFIRFRAGDPNEWRILALAGIKVNGILLVQSVLPNFDYDIDYFDTPTSNYATYNPVAFANSSGGTYSAANLGNAAGSNWDIAAPTVKLGTTEKWYAEFDFKTNYHASTMFGMVDVTVDPTDGYANKLNPGFGVGMAGDSGYKDGSLYNSGSQFAPDFRTTGGYMMWAYDAATRNVWIGKDGTWYGSGDPASGANPTITLTAGNEYTLSISSYSSSVGFANFGQMPFVFTPPTGYKALQTNNLPEPTIKDGQDHFECILWNGNDTDDRNITTSNGFAPDLVWIKCRNAAQNHTLFDTCRGATLRIMPNLSNDEDTQANDLQAFNSDGFQVGTQARVNASGNTYVAWCWKAGGAPTATNTATGSDSPTSGSVMINGAASTTALTGTIKASKISVNTTAGFSIVSYTGNSTNGATVDHGLGGKPDVVVVKARNPASQQHWHIKHVGLDNESNSVRFDATGPQADFNAWGGLAPDANVFKLGPVDGTNDDTKNYIAYCWRAVEGFSKFGTYETNVSNDGPYVFLGFKPALVILKSIDQTTSVSWKLVDHKRSPNNLSTGIRLYAQDNVAETTHTNEAIDLLSNGFKIRGTSNSQNAPDVNKTYIYLAWAKSPFGGENAPPATGR